MLNLKTVSFIILSLVINAAAAQEAFRYDITRDLKTPISWVFDPMKIEDNWISLHQYEMPEPSGGSDSMRKLVDAKRQLYLNNKVQSRGNYSGKPADPAFIAPKIEKQYNGGSGGGTPNDNHLAVGNDGRFINVLNTVIRVHDANGNIVKAWSLENFTVPPNKKIDPIPTLTRVFDPRVVYDPIRDRYIVLFMHGTTDVNSFIVVGFSTSSNPSDPWNVYRIPGKPTKDSIWSDYPIVAHNSEDLFFTVNLIGVGASWEEGFTEAVIWQIGKDEGFKGDTLHKTVFTNIKYQGKSLRSICSIQNAPLPTGTDNYFVTMRPLDEKNDTAFLLRVTNTQASGQAKLELQVLKTEIPYGFPPSALQKDTAYKLRTNDCRALSGIRTGNTIQYLQNSVNFKTYQAHLTHSTIFNIDGNAFIRGGLITDDSFDMGYPAIAPAGSDENDLSALITFVYSSPWHFPGTAVIYRNRYGEYSNIVNVKKGESLIYYSFIPKGEQRWGDYEAIQAKFNEPGVFYLVGSYGQNNFMNAWVARISIQDTVWDDPVSEVKVFPIPSQTELFTEVMVRDEGNYGVELYNMSGQKVKDKPSLYLSAGTNLLRVNADELAPGEYILHLKREGRIIHKQKISIL